MDPYQNDEEVIHLNVVYEDDRNGDRFHCMSAADMQEAYDAYEDHSDPRFQLYGPRDSIVHTEMPQLELTVDHASDYYWRNQNSELHCVREDPMEFFNFTLPAKIKAMEKYEIDLEKHIENKKALDLLKTMKSMYDLQSFVDTYSNALETVRDFFHLYSKIMSMHERQWARAEIEYMKALRKSLQDYDNTIYDDHKTKIDLHQTQIMRSVQLEDEERQQLAVIERLEDMNTSAISELKTRIHSRVIRTDAVDRENLESMNVLIQKLELFLSKPNNNISEDVAWKSQVTEFVKFLEYRKKKSRLNVWKLEINIMEIPDLSAYNNAYLSVCNDVDKYLSSLGQESPEDKSWKMNERYYGEYIAQVQALHMQIAKLSTTKRSKKEALQLTEQILMKIDFIEKAIQFTVMQNQDSWRKEKEYMDYLRNLAVFEEHSERSNMACTPISQDIKLYEMNNKQRVVFENRA